MNNKKQNTKNTQSPDIWMLISVILGIVLIGWIGFYFVQESRVEDVTLQTTTPIIDATDAEVKDDINDQLFWDSRVSSDTVNVSVENGRVTLTGSVDSYTAKKAAAQSALDVAGVISVDNELAIELPTTTEIPKDDVLIDRVENLLSINPDLEATDITIKATNGNVILEGTVDSLWKTTVAEDTAYNALGVYNVDNQLAVVYTEKVTDERIAEDIVNALERNVSLDEEDIDVRVTNGKVTLSGKVQNLTQFNEAEDAAFFTTGVTNVENNLTIE